MRKVLTILFFISAVIYCFDAQAQQKTNLPSLGTVLNADGTINTGTGVSGSFNPAGYSMDYGANGQPVFKPMGIESDGDDYWDDRFFGEGTNSTIRAIAIAANGDVYLGGDFTSKMGWNNFSSLKRRA